MSMASPCYEPTGNHDQDVGAINRLKALNLDMKIVYSKTVIQKFYIENNGKVYVSFSGGKDSTVLLHLVRSKYPEVPAVFFDTGMEFPENRKFVKTFDNIEFVKPKMNFKEVLDKYGYPCIGKEIAKWIGEAQKGYECSIKKMSEGGRYGGKRYQYMVDAPFKVSSKCCDVMKKRPAYEYWKNTGRASILGTRIEESQLREQNYLKYGENRETHNMPSSNPLSVWSEKDVDDYIARYGIKLSDAYTKLGRKRTGCMFCMFGIMAEPNRFVELKSYHPAVWRQCMKPREEGGLGMKEVLEFMGVPTGCEQTSLKDFMECENVSQ